MSIPGPRVHLAYSANVMHRALRRSAAGDRSAAPHPDAVRTGWAATDAVGFEPGVVLDSTGLIHTVTPARSIVPDLGPVDHPATRQYPVNSELDVRRLAVCQSHPSLIGRLDDRDSESTHPLSGVSESGTELYPGRIHSAVELSLADPCDRGIHLSHPRVARRISHRRTG